MKLAKILVATVAGGVLAASLAGCGAKASSTPESQIATVQRGDITVSITGTGNLAYSKTADLAFEMAGIVQEVLVEEGEIVTEGQKLAGLDGTEWDDQVNMMEKALTAAQRNLKSAERQITAKELAVRQVELDLQSAEDNVADIPAVKAAQDLVDMAESALTAAQATYGANPSFTGTQLQAIQQQLADAKRNLHEVLAGKSFNTTSDMALQISKANLKVEQVQRQLEDAKIAVEDANLAKTDAEQSLEDAQNDLDEAKGLTPAIVAPFAGVVTSVKVEGGAEVKKGAVAVQIADPTKFEANILVGENDIFQVKLDGDATVQVDSLSGLSLPAKVTYVAPTATVQQGVVNYRVMVELQSLEEIAQQRQQATQGAGQADASTQLSERLKQAVQSGRMTQEQADAFLKQMQEGGSAFFQQGTSGSQSPFGQRFQQGAAAPESFQLRQGLSVTVNIVTAERNNVLLVPNDAVTRKAGATLVNVQANGSTEQRQVTCGISDWQHTEIINGLTEGDQVVITKSTSTSASGSNQGSQQRFGVPGGGFMIR